MMTKSATPATPVTRPKSHINDSLTWTKDWQTPLEYVGGSTPSFRLKGWFKSPNSDNSSKGPNVNTTDVYKLDNYRYLEEPVVIEASEDANTQPRQEGGLASESNDDPQKNGHNDQDLRLALSMDKKDDQISSLSGLGM